MELKAIDLFAGIGGLRIGTKNIFGDLIQYVFSSEIDKHAQKAYFANYGEKSVGDITLIDADEVPNHNMILAGFPCQPFSNAGKKEGFEDARGTLFFEIARIAEKHRPEILFLENVKNFRTHDKGNTFRVVKKTLEELGYKVYSTVLNAKDFGLPQSRERFFMICFRNHDIRFKFPEPLGVKTRLGDILEKNVDPKYTISDRLWEGHKRRRKKHAQKGNGFGFNLYDEESEYTATLTARYYKDGAEILIKQGHGLNPRKLTPREAARLQGFPDSFKIAVSDTQAYKQFGNAVPINVIDAISEEIKIAVENYENTFHE